MKTISKTISKIPSYCEISPSIDNAINNSETPIIIGTSFRIVILLTTSGVIIAAMPTTIPTLAILLPITFPRIIALCSPAAAMLAANSGVEVPYATTVIPIINLLIPSFFAIETPPSTK